VFTQDRVVQLLGEASVLSWRYEIHTRPDDEGSTSNSNRLLISLRPVDTGGQFPEGQSLDLTVSGDWEARELITVLQHLVDDLVEILGPGWPVSSEEQPASS